VTSAMGASSDLTSHRFGVRAAGLLAALILFLATGRVALAESFIDYLYVEANEGDSSGGHVALRFGEEVFHFQHESPGVLKLQRTPAAAFRYSYSMLGNRSIRESRIAVAEDTYSLLRDAFVRLQLIQGAQLEIRDALQQDVTLFELLLRQGPLPGGGREIVLPIKGLGYFLPDQQSSRKAAADAPSRENAAHSPALLSLRSRIPDTYGETFIADRMAGAQAALRGLTLRASGKPVARLSRDDFPSVPSPLSTRYQESLHALCALQLLKDAPPLRAGTFWRPGTDVFELTPSEAPALQRFAAQLEQELVQLVNSPRADWGLPFLVGLARLAAVEASLASGRLVLLDLFPPGSELSPRHDAALRPYLKAMEGELSEVFLRKRKGFFAAETFREADYAALERSGNLLLDVDRALLTGAALRATPQDTFPAREAKVSVPPPGLPKEANLERELASARAVDADYRALLDRLYGYDLVRRNCVTEIFAVINHALARLPAGREGSPSASQSAARSESAKRLGGFVDAGHGLTFIPFVSSGAVEKSYKVVASRNLPSYRSARLAEMREHEPSLKVFWRESNTLTSSAYRPGPGDSAFLFFTDDTVLFRPLFGAFNLLAGLGEGLFGVATLPLSGADRLLAGTKGLLFSLPELVFVNLRKGSMAYVEQPPKTPGPDGK